EDAGAQHAVGRMDEIPCEGDDAGEDVTDGAEGGLAAGGGVALVRGERPGALLGLAEEAGVVDEYVGVRGAVHGLDHPAHPLGVLPSFGPEPEVEERGENGEHRPERGDPDRGPTGLEGDETL